MHTLRLRQAAARRRLRVRHLRGRHARRRARRGARPERVPRPRARASDDAWILYHFSIGSPLFDLVRELDVPLALDYHNITDAKYFWRWEPRAATTHARRPPPARGRRAGGAVRARRLRVQRARARRRSAARAPRSRRSSSTSPTTTRRPTPTLLADAAARARSAAAPTGSRSGGSRPTSASTTCCSRSRCTAASTTRARGSRSSAARAPGSTGARCTRLAEDLDIADAVTFTDVVSHAELLACYRTADVFAVPLRARGLQRARCSRRCTSTCRSSPTPRRRCPTPSATAGLLLTDKDPVVVATAVERLRSDASLRQGLVDAGRKRVEHFSIARTGPQLLDTLTTLMKETAVKPSVHGAPMAESPRPARVRPAPLRHRDRRRLRSGDARSRARARARAAGTSRCSPPARAITTPGATSTSPARPPHDDGVVVHRFPVEGSKPKRSRARIEARIQSGARGAARRPARLARRAVPRSRPVPPPRRQLRPLRRGDPVAVPVLDDRHRRDDRSRAHDRDAVPARRAVRAPRGAQSRAVRRRAPLVPLRARARARARAARRCPPTSSPARACTFPTSYDPEGFCARHGLDAPVPPVRRPARARQGLGLAARRVPLRDPPVRRCRSIS